jgi:hypothetical protein
VRVSLTFAVGTALVLLFATPVYAGTGDVVETRSDAPASTIGASVSTTSFSSGGGGPSACSWTVNPDLGFVYPELPGDVPSTSFTRDGVVHRLYLKACPGLPDAYEFVPDVSPRDVIDEARRELSRRLPKPALAMNPPAASGGIVNLGMWLAVADAGEVSVTAQLGPIWATVRARQRDLTWDMGNGATIVCTGVGTPIADLSTAEAGPCGYAYRRTSAGQPNSEYQVVVTSVWAVSYTSSVGAGVLGDVPVSAGFGYRVRELQTIGVSG